MAKLLTYEQKDTWMDRLCGVTKLIYFLAWSITSMLTYDTRVLAVMLVLSLILFKISKTEWKQVGSIYINSRDCATRLNKIRKGAIAPANIGGTTAPFVFHVCF